MWGRDAITFDEAGDAGGYEIRDGVTVAHSIVTGGDVQSDLCEQTSDVDADGQTRVLSIDYVPEGPRA